MESKLENSPKLSKNERYHINELIKKIDYDSDIYGLIRYGSSVLSSKYNDVDLCIISKREISVKKQYEYSIFLPEKYDIHFFHILPIYIQKEVLETGIYEYIKNYDKLFDICAQSIKEYSLFEPKFLNYLELIKNY